MTHLKSIKRADLTLAADEIAPLAPGGAEQRQTVALLNGRRYNPREILQVIQNQSNRTEGLNVTASDDNCTAFFQERMIPVVSASTLDKTVGSLKGVWNDPEIRPDLKKVADAKDGVISRYGTLFSSERTASITKEDVWGFLNFNNNHHWKTLQRNQARITSDMSALRAALTTLVEKTRPIDERLNEIRPLHRKPMVKWFGKATITAILHVSDPDEYGVWNGMSERGWIDSKLWPDIRSNTPFGTYYQTVNEILKTLAYEIGIDLWTLDAVWWNVPKDEMFYWRV